MPKQDLAATIACGFCQGKNPAKMTEAEIKALCKTSVAIASQLILLSKSETKEEKQRNIAGASVDGSYKMPFGKFKGKTLVDISMTSEGTQYLVWASENLGMADIKKKIKDFIDKKSGGLR